jgi:hypothetical protein
VQLPLTRIVLIAIFLLAIALRWWFLSDNNLAFFYDQARDAFLSRSIYEQGDLRLLGPSASGSGDGVYHGVLYYYLLGLLYLILDHPVWVTMALAIVQSTGIFALYLIGRDIFHNKQVGLVAAFLFAVNANSVFLGTWLSNPITASVTIPLFFYCIWQGFFANKYHYLPLAALFLGLSNQAVLFSGYLTILTILILVAYFVLHRGAHFPWKATLVSAAVYLLTISSIVLAQYKLYRDGINSSLLPSVQGNDRTFFDILAAIRDNYTLALDQSLIPDFTVTSVALLFLFTAFFFWQASLKQRLWSILYVLSPLILLLLVIRRDGHTLIGLTSIFFIFLSYPVVFIKNRIALVFACLLLLGYSAYQISYLNSYKAGHGHRLLVQADGNLQDALDVIDYTYQYGGPEFSISTLTNPLKINTAWSYLYQWYGQASYGYLPSWYGPTQQGIFGAGILPETPQILPKHFLIIEPGNMFNNYAQQVKNEQNIFTNVVQAKSFFGFEVERREVRNTR